MAYVSSIYTKKNSKQLFSGNPFSMSSLFPSTELLNEELTMYYLQNLPECRVNIARGLALLYELEESEEQIYQAVSLRSRSIQDIKGSKTSCPDQLFIKVQEEYENEKRAIQKERVMLQNHLKKENQKIVVIEGCIFSLPEPHRSVIIARYIERMSWPAIQQKLKRSASRIYCLHKEGITGIQDAVRKVNGVCAPERAKELRDCIN